MSAVAFLGLWAVMQLFSNVARPGVPTAETGGVAFWPPIGGFAFGLLAGWPLQGCVRHRLAD